MAWLQERQYQQPYHWQATRNPPIEYELRTRAVLDLLGLEAPAAHLPPLRLLDVGCGDARFLDEAARHTRACGVDVSQRALAHARTQSPALHVCRADAHRLPFPHESFDIVTLLDVIEHVPDPLERAVIREAHRVLRPGGQLVISTNTERSFVEWKHYRHYSPARFAALFSPGFEAPRTVGLIPYFSGLRFLMQAPLVWPLFTSRIRLCPPGDGQVIVGVARRCHGAGNLPA